MRIDINQGKITIGDKYKIFIEGKQSYKAANELFKLFATINLIELANERTRITIKRQLAFLKAKYNIMRWDGNTMEYQTVSYWRSHYQCQDGNDIYDIYAHRGRKHSVYKNDVQVAWWDKDAVTWFEGDNYRLMADDDCDKELIIAFCLLMDNYTSNKKNDGIFNIDFGHLGPQVKKFNPDWKPKG